MYDNYRKKTEKSFIISVRHLYREDINLSFHDCVYYFEGNTLEFERIRDKYNIKYIDKGVAISLTPEEAGKKLN